MARLKTSDCAAMRRFNYSKMRRYASIQSLFCPAMSRFDQLKMRRFILVRYGAVRDRQLLPTESVTRSGSKSLVCACTHFVLLLRIPPLCADSTTPKCVAMRRFSYLKMRRYASIRSSKTVALCRGSAPI